jgi:two-component system response regulator
MNRKHILLVDDNPDDVELGRCVFQKHFPHIELKVLRDGAEALEYLKATAERNTACPLPSAMLVDLQMPRMCGLDLLEKIKTDPHLSRLRVPVVILTSSRQSKDVLKAYDLGARSYLVKPVNFLEFHRMIQQFCIYWLELNEPATVETEGVQSKPASEREDIPTPS